MTKATAEQTLRAQILLERDALNAKYGQRHGASFGEFLQARAQAGDALALVELRRMRPTTPDESKPEESWIMPAGEQSGSRRKAPAVEGQSDGANEADQADDGKSSDSGYDNQIIYRVLQLSYEVHRDGDVTYRHDGRSVVRDQGRAVRVLQTDRVAIEAALRLAHAKFGTVLKLQGPAHMQREAAIVAAEAGLYVEFSDESLNDIMQARRVELIADRATAVETRTQDRSRLRDTPLLPTPAASGRDVGPAISSACKQPDSKPHNPPKPAI
jgi:hypothetical protein